MNKILIAELDKLNETYPFRVFELETLDGRRIRVTQRFRKLWDAEEKADGDIVVQGEVIAVLKYAQLKDVLFLVPQWKRPFTWMWHHPIPAMIPVIVLFFICEIFSFSLLSQCQERRRERIEQHK